MRLIDADNLKEQIKAIHQAVDTTSVNTDYDTGFHSATSQVMGLVEFLPTVEAVPVVHGEWIKEYINRYGHPCHCCSVCGFHASHQDKNFCPECGADMRKKEGK